MIGVCWPADERGRVDVPVADGGHGDNHTVHALEVGEGLLVVEVGRVPVVLDEMDEARRGPPDRHKHRHQLEQPTGKKM